MSEIVNLNKFRKKQARGDAERLAAANRATFGRSKQQRQEAARKNESAGKDLDGKRLD